MSDPLYLNVPLVEAPSEVRLIAALDFICRQFPFGDHCDREREIAIRDAVKWLNLKYGETS